MKKAYGIEVQRSQLWIANGVVAGASVMAFQGAEALGGEVRDFEEIKAAK